MDAVPNYAPPLASQHYYQDVATSLMAGNSAMGGSSAMAANSAMAGNSAMGGYQWANGHARPQQPPPPQQASQQAQQGSRMGGGYPPPQAQPPPQQAYGTENEHESELAFIISAFAAAEQGTENSGIFPDQVTSI
jgi:hypothetical protein